MTTFENEDVHPHRPVRKAELRKINRVGSRAPHISTVAATTIGQRITARRMELKLTQADVAKQVPFHNKTGRNKGAERPLSRGALAMYEIGDSEPDLKKLEAIAKALGVSPGWLAFGDETAVVPEKSDMQVGEDGIEITTWVIPKVVRADEPDISSPETRTVVIKIRR